MKDFMEVLGQYEEKVRPLNAEKERINSQIKKLADLIQDSDSETRFKVLERRLEEAYVDKDSEKLKLLTKEFSELTPKMREKAKILHEDTPLLRRELERLNRDMLSIGADLEKEAARSVRAGWHSKLNEALDFVEGGSLALGEFRKKVGIAGFSSDYQFQIDFSGARDLIVRFKKYMPRFREA